MSARVSSNKKPNVFNDANESLYDSYPEFTVSERYATVPWPEWNDAELNSEVWEEPKGKSASTGSKVSGSLTSPAPFFEDSAPPDLPSEIRDYVDSWKRPHEVFVKSNLCVYDPANVDYDLSVPSPVADCTIFKCFNELVPILCYYGSQDGFPVEMETSTFVPTTQGEFWRPWHHVYALSKAGKGQTHKPLYCFFGKYILRLFYFGCWRMIIVDDRIPCDKYGLCMLPVTQSRGELWSVLLAKGILKIISLTGSTMDFSLISCLTGWVSARLITANKSFNQIWRRMQLLVPRYELPRDEAETKNIVASVKGSSQKNSSIGQSRPVETIFEKFCVLLANLEGFTAEMNLNEVNVVVTMNRDLPLIKADRREKTKPWKRFRWVYWASKKGIWTDELSLPPYRRLQLISFEKQLKELLAPDPMQEATLYSLPKESSRDSRSAQDLGSGDKVPHEPKQWSDFYKFCEYLVDLTVFFKPSYFLSDFKITCFQSGLTKKDAITPATAKTFVKSDPQNLYFYSPELMPTLNHPALLYCDSITGIFICLSLWVCPKEKKSSVGYLDAQQPEILKVGHGALIVERFDWRNLEQGEIVGFTKTVGNSTILLNLKPGRHVLKLWLNCDSPYALHVFSNTDLCVHKGPKIRFLMVNESERIKQYISKVSDEFLALTLKFGKPELPSALRSFYEALKPGNDGALLYFRKLDKFIETFLNCLMAALNNAIPNTDEVKIMLGALRSLFLSPNIECQLPRGQPASLYGAAAKKATKKVTVVLAERTLSEILQYPWTPDEIRQVVMIQKVFRGYRIRLLFRYQNPTRKECKPYGDRLKKICDVIFGSDKRIAEVGKIIRMMIAADPDLLNTFKFHSDFPNVINIDEFSGKIFCSEPFGWIPIARFIIACHSSVEPEPCAFYFSCNLEQYVVMGVNNDTNEEMFSVANTVPPCYYPANKRGYTIFIFGWNEASPKTVNWRLEMVKMKYFRAVHLCNMMLSEDCHPYLLPSIEVNEIKNFYVPNQNFRMCRCVIKVQKRSLLTCRLSASFADVQFVLTVSLDKRWRCNSAEESKDSTDKDVFVTQCTSARGAAFLSSIVLENVQKNELWSEADENHTLYVLEAHILNDSWPLTKQEWGVIEPIRVNGGVWKDSSSNTQLRKAGSESRKKLTRMTKRSLQERNIENPFWSLQILNDSSEGDPTEAMTVEEDRSYQESVKAMKSFWEEKNPGRRKRGKDVRLKFLQAMHYEYCLRQTEGEFEWDPKSDDGNQFDVKEDFKELFHKMSSFSYLTNDKSEERFSKSPRVLPWMPTRELLTKYKRDWKESTENSSTECSVSESRNRSVVDEEEEERKEFLATRGYYRFVVLNYLAEERKLTNELMEQAYKQRFKAVQRMMG